MGVLEALINWHIKRRLPVGCGRAETIRMALDSAEDRLRSEATELLNDVLSAIEQNEKDRRGNNNSK